MTRRLKRVDNDLIEWHLQHDNCRALAKFCDKYQVDRKIGNYYDGYDGKYFQMTTWFANGAWIVAELKQGTDISECYQVVSHDWGQDD